MKLTIKHSGFYDLDFTRKPFDEVLIHDAVRGRKKSEHMRDKVTHVIIEFVLPVVEVLGEIYTLGSPEGRLRLFVHLPNLDHLLDTLETPSKGLRTYLVVLDREKNAALGFFEDRFVLLVEIEIANEAVAGVVDNLFLSWLGRLGGFLSGGGDFGESGSNDKRRHGCYGIEGG
jgi:hypothetical protein